MKAVKYIVILLLFVTLEINLKALKNNHMENIDKIDEEEFQNLCTSCNGSGEGMWDGSTCSTCKGTGVKIK